jgi:hypothetical protein
MSELSNTVSAWLVLPSTLLWATTVPHEHPARRRRDHDAGVPVRADIAVLDPASAAGALQADAVVGVVPEHVLVEQETRGFAAEGADVVVEEDRGGGAAPALPPRHTGGRTRVGSQVAELGALDDELRVVAVQDVGAAGLHWDDRTRALGIPRGDRDPFEGGLCHAPAQVDARQCGQAHLPHRRGGDAK